jgi:hypothetical protein
MVAGMLSAPMAHAKPCRRLCRLQIKACYQTCTTPPKAACKSDCRSHFIDECKKSSSVPKERTCPNSPSGAFLD